MEFKGNTSLPLQVDGSNLKCNDGIVHGPTGVGIGVTLDPEYLKLARPVTL